MGQAGGGKGHGLWIDQVCAQFRLFCAAAMVIRDCSRSNNVKQLLMNYIKTVANLDQLSWQFKCALHISVYCSLVGKACDSTYLYSALQCNIPQMATTCNNKCCNMSQSLHSNGWILDLLRQASTTDPVAVAFALPLPGVASPWPGWTDRLGKSEQALGIIGICLKSVFCFFWVCPMFEYEIILDYIIFITKLL